MADAEEIRDDGEYGTVTLTLEDDTELNCMILSIFPAGGKSYIALLPIEDDGTPKDEDVLLYRYIDHGDEDPELDNIDSDEEYDIAADAFDELLDEAEYEDEAGEDEEG